MKWAPPAAAGAIGRSPFSPLRQFPSICPTAPLFPCIPFRIILFVFLFFWVSFSFFCFGFCAKIRALREMHGFCYVSLLFDPIYIYFHILYFWHFVLRFVLNDRRYYQPTIAIDWPSCEYQVDVTGHK
jgi:hypothetical protein